LTCRRTTGALANPERIKAKRLVKNFRTALVPS
jgi:hypothetical protein